jgi:hypothetical protein
MGRTDLVNAAGFTARRRHRRRTLRSLTAVLLGLLALAGVVRAEDGSPPTQVTHVPPIAFVPANSTTSYVVEAGGLGRLCLSKAAAYFVARLQLSDGAVIERVSALVEDTNRDGLGMLSLVRRGAQSFEILAMTPISTETGEVETLTTTEISPPVVDNTQGAYLLQAVLTGPGVCLHDVQVTYRVP